MSGWYFKRNIQRHEGDWLRAMFRLRGSVVPAVLPRTLLCSLFALVITGLHAKGWGLSFPILGSVVPSIVLGLLLVFRTNTAYERFWEGRKLWGNVINQTRNLARQMWVAIQEHQPTDHEVKVAAMRLLPAFAIAMKLHLRGESMDQDQSLISLLTADQFIQLQQMKNPPLRVALWIADYLQTQQAQGKFNPYQLSACLKIIDSLVDSLGSCERILKTPIPLAYSIHLRQLLMLYCLALPFQLVDSVGWGSVLVVGLISFAVFGIEEIGIEIENPFGHDPNDLPLDSICLTMQQNIEDLISLTPHARQWPQGAVSSPSDAKANAEIF
ncbi:MAG: bestrophin family protein [Nodosilinea sp.]